MAARPGRDTVHIWSRVRSFSDCRREATKSERRAVQEWSEGLGERCRARCCPGKSSMQDGEWEWEQGRLEITMETVPLEFPRRAWPRTEVKPSAYRPTVTPVKRTHLMTR